MINETISTNPSAATTPAGPTSEAVVRKNGPGNVALEMRISGGDWEPLLADMAGAVVVATPDDTIEYRFRPVDLENDADVYFGP